MEDTPRVLHFIPSLSSAVGGPARAVIDLCGALSLRGNAITVATTDVDPEPPWRGCPSPELRLLGPLSLGAINRRSDLDNVRELIAEHDLVHLHGVWEYANIQIGRLCSLLQRPYIVSPHGMLDTWSMHQRRLKKKVYLRVFGTQWLNAAAGIHTTTQFERQQSSLYFARDRGRVIPLMVDLGPFSPAPPSPQPHTVDRPLRVLYLSRIDPKKSIETLLRAGEILAQRGRRVSLLVAGSGEDPYVARTRALASVLRLDIQFVGMVTGSAKTLLYHSCDVFALPTKHENFGIVYLEALATGLPVVTTPHTGLSQDLHESGAALVVQRSPECFADAIESLILDPAKRLRMGTCGRDWVLRQFDREAIAKQFERFYLDIAGRTNAT
ncbi:MAG TPA: glycosyltransferase [Paraburkholderia sp.]|uniref:glycosyltransferase n=1 Tax=Paraburkholderia sp. TaxID=1926495 RepID=UPI002B46E857|nr:glycosyltransferase [Paraburkholderia sp.]HKR41464.1 glycosyltransferase [Paraburkholderia sp.]